MSSIRPMFRDLDLAVADDSPDTTCFVDAALKITYCNPAWDRFALANGGALAVAEQVCGRCLLDFAPPEFLLFYRTVFASCAADQQPFAFDYECSSANVFRLFRMNIMPLRAGGFALSHWLRMEQPHQRKAEAPGPEYAGPGGAVTLCCHCRRSRRETDPSRWDWVPRHVEAGAFPVNSSVCPPCRSYFYGLVGNRIASAALIPR